MLNSYSPTSCSFPTQIPTLQFDRAMFQLPIGKFRKLEHCPIKLQRWYLRWKRTTGMTVQSLLKILYDLHRLYAFCQVSVKA